MPLESIFIEIKLGLMFVNFQRISDQAFSKYQHN